MLLIAIAGGSGSGKSAVARGIAEALGPEQAALLAQDAYYRDRTDLLPIERERLNYDVPGALDHALFREHVAALRRGRAVVPPVYCFVTHRRAGWGPPVPPRPVVLVEGRLVLHDPELVRLFDLRVFVDAPEPVRLERRIERDVRERGRTRASVVAQCHTSVFPAHARYVEPTRAHADLVLLNAGRLDPLVEVACAVIRAEQARRPAGQPQAA